MINDKAKRPAKTDGGNILHRRGCACEACDLIRKGDIKRTDDARTK